MTEVSKLKFSNDREYNIKDSQSRKRLERLEATDIKVYDTLLIALEDMSLSLNEVIETNGYHELNDLGNERYVVVSDGIEDGGSFIKLNNGLYLKHLISKEYMNVASWGIKPKENIVPLLNTIIKYCSERLLRVVISREYGFSGQGIFLRDNTHLTIDGKLISYVLPNSVFQTFDGVTPTPGYTASKNIIIDGHGIVSMNAGASGMETCEGSPFRIHHAKNVTIKDITILDVNEYHGIEAGATDGLIIDGVKFNGLVRPDLNSWRHGECIQIEQAGVGAGGAIPYDETPTKNVLIQNCVFKSEGLGKVQVAIGSHGVPQDQMYTNIKIINNHFEDVYRTCITPCAWEDVVIEGNTAKNCKTTFIGYINPVAPTIKGGVISNNVLTNMGEVIDEAGQGADGLLLYNRAVFTLYSADNLLISGNVVDGCYHGVVLLATSKNVIIKNNSFYDYAKADNEFGVSLSRGIFIIHFNDRPIQTNITIESNQFATLSTYHDSPIHIQPGTVHWTNRIFNNQFRLQTDVRSADMKRIAESNNRVLFEGSLFGVSNDVITLNNTPLIFKNLVFEIEDGQSGYRKQVSFNLNMSGGSHFIIDFTRPANDIAYIRSTKICFTYNGGTELTIAWWITTYVDSDGTHKITTGETESARIRKIWGEW